MKEVIKISGRKNTKQYVEVCEICGAQYIATRKGSRVCSNVCRSQKSRNKHSKQFKVQSKVIRTQTEVINILTPKPDVANKLPLESEVVIQELSSVTGKDLTECKRPDGQHLYTYEDLCILTAKLIRQVYNPGSEVALFNKFTEMDVIEDFEHRFKCRFDDTRKANSNGKLYEELGRTFEAHNAFYLKYAGLKYSR
jgi:hypothetical protein